MRPGQLNLGNAPLAREARECRNAEDRRLAKRKDLMGCDARFRLRHGRLGDFVVAELMAGTRMADIVGALRNNVANAVITLAFNSRAPDRAMVAFVDALVDVLKEAAENAADGMTEFQGNMVEVNEATGELRDLSIPGGAK